MRKRFDLDEETGLLTARDGTVLRINSMSVDIVADGGPIGGSSVGSERTTEGQQETLLREGGVGETQSPSVDDQAITSVWEHYVAVHQPRNTNLPPAERKLIRTALKVASADEIKTAISGCAASDFHMGHNDRRRKYNSLSQIIKGRQGRETQRERIDYFIDLYVKSGKAAGTSGFDLSRVPSVMRATVNSQRALVRKGLASDDEHARQMGQAAAEWLQAKWSIVPIIEDGELKGWRYDD